MTPLSLAFLSGETPARTPQVAVYLLNPYSPRQEEALAYLAYIAQAQEGSALVSLYEVNEPQESSEYRRRYATLVENVQDVYKRQLQVFPGILDTEEPGHPLIVFQGKHSQTPWLPLLAGSRGSHVSG